MLPGLIKVALELELAAELTDQLGYEKGDPRVWRPRASAVPAASFRECLMGFFYSSFELSWSVDQLTKARPAVTSRATPA